MAAQAPRPKKGETMKKKPEAPARTPTPEQQLARMKDFMRRILAVSKDEIRPKPKRKRH